MTKVLRVELTDEEMRSLEGLAARLERWEKFIPAGLLPIVRKVESAVKEAREP